ncbi:MAG: hypothetical protein WBG50_06005 [Desulfomonilaceae bacterium]
MLQVAPGEIARLQKETLQAFDAAIRSLRDVPTVFDERTRRHIETCRDADLLAERCIYYRSLVEGRETTDERVA